ncbi:MAG: 3-dehydroquinate synthase [Tepidisphaeraceae bacterium]
MRQPPKGDTPAVPAMHVPDRMDISFDVPFTHRVRFTQDAFGFQADELLDLFETVPGKAARVLVCVDADVDAGTNVSMQVHRWSLMRPGAIELVDILVIPGGERIKNHPEPIKHVLESIETAGLDRRSYVMAIGGGAFLDAVGFAAGLAHRGVRLVRLPTSTMGQADSGLGVKTAVNYFGKKNWLGHFAVPWAVVNDRKLLDTLPDRDWRCGFSEAVKVSLLKEPAFFERLCETAKSIAARDTAASDFAIRRSAYWHLQHITRGGDPFEANEARPLDFGHWSAHRLEAMTNFEVRHGEAVAIGLAIDCAYSRRVHGLPADREQQVRRCLADLGMTLHHPALANAEALLDGLEEFRQHLGGRLTITMLQNAGSPIDVHHVDRTAMREAILSLC